MTVGLCFQLNLYRWASGFPGWNSSHEVIASVNKSLSSAFKLFCEDSQCAQTYLWGSSGLRQKKSLMAEWIQQVFHQWHEMYCHDLEIMGLIPIWIELGMHSTSVLSLTWTKTITVPGRGLGISMETGSSYGIQSTDKLVSSFNILFYTFWYAQKPLKYDWLPCSTKTYLYSVTSFKIAHKGDDTGILLCTYIDHISAILHNKELTKYIICSMWIWPR